MFGMEFDLVDYVRDWREHRAYFYDCQQNLTSVPTSWTNLFPLDPFVAASAGRSYFRTDELLQLVKEIKSLEDRKNRVK
jgi:hypothetical protein